MAANDDIQIYALSNFQPLTSVAAQIILPASAGVSNVLKTLDAKIVNNAGVVEVTVNVLDGATLVWQGFLYTSAANVADEITETFNIVGTAGNTMTIQFGGVTPTLYESLSITASVQ